jgi:hypothetical protein
MGAKQAVAIPTKKPSILMTKKIKHIANKVAIKAAFIAENKTIRPSLLAKKKPKPSSIFGRITHNAPHKAEKPWPLEKRANVKQITAPKIICVTSTSLTPREAPLIQADRRGL